MFDASAYKTKRAAFEDACKVAGFALDTRNFPHVEKYKGQTIVVTPMFDVERVSWFYVIVWADDPNGPKYCSTSMQGDRKDLLIAAKAHVDQAVG